MSSHSYFLVTGIVFAVLALVHLMRILNGWSLVIGPFDAPAVASVVAALIAAVLSFLGFKLSRSAG